MSTNTSMVPRHPPPSLYAPYPAMSVFNQFCMVILFQEEKKKIMPWRLYHPHVVQHTNGTSVSGDVRSIL